MIHPTNPQYHALYPPRADLEAAFRSVRHAKLPQLPDIVHNLHEELRRSEPDLTRAANLIAMDPALTGLVLKTINSPLFGRGTKISSVHQAAALIGLRRLTNLVTAAAFNRLLDEYEGGARLILDFIQEQTQVAAAIATLTPELKPDEASLFALMQGVGCLIFADLVPDYGNEWALRALTAPQTLIEYERRILGTDHVTVGFLVAGTWHLPESVVLAIYHQYALEPPAQFEGSLRLLIAVARLARVVLARRRGIEDDPDLLDQRDWALAELAMPPAAWEQRISSLLADERGH